MSRQRETRCGSCSKFDIRGAADGDGTALCPDFNVRHHWSDLANPCVLHQLVRGEQERATRMRWIEIVTEKHPMKEEQQ
jgi:hypothetical protein